MIQNPVLQSGGAVETCQLSASGFLSQTWFYGDNQSSTEASVTVPKNQVLGITVSADMIPTINTSGGVSILSQTSDRFGSQKTLILYCTGNGSLENYI